MSVTSTRRISASYSSPTKEAYGAAQSHQSFVETIDTSNNVSIQDEPRSGGQQAYNQPEDERTFEETMQDSQNSTDSGVRSDTARTPLFDNNEDSVSHAQNKSVGIYDTNQLMSRETNEKVDNPYLKHLYENNEVIEDVDELV